jgi:uncharacterized membrane protein
LGRGPFGNFISCRNKAPSGDLDENESEVGRVVALIALLLIIAIFGGLGFAAHVLWIVLAVLFVLWLLGFVFGGMEGGRRRWYGRW